MSAAAAYESSQAQWLYESTELTAAMASRLVFKMLTGFPALPQERNPFIAIL